MVVETTVVGLVAAVKVLGNPVVVLLMEVVSEK